MVIYVTNHLKRLSTIAFIGLWVSIVSLTYFSLVNTHGVTAMLIGMHMVAIGIFASLYAVIPDSDEEIREILEDFSKKVLTDNK